jgi:hypothetical protein
MLLEGAVVRSHVPARHHKRLPAVPGDLADLLRAIVRVERTERAQRRRRGKRHEATERAKGRTVVYIADLRARPA